MIAALSLTKRNEPPGAIISVVKKYFLTWRISRAMPWEQPKEFTTSFITFYQVMLIFWHHSKKNSPTVMTWHHLEININV